MATTHGKQQERRPEGKEGAGAHQEGQHAEQAGHTNRRASGYSQKHERALREEGGDRGVDAARQTGEEPGDDNQQKGGDRSNRAAQSGATGERNSSGGQNKPEPRNQDEKGMGHPRNR